MDAGGIAKLKYGGQSYTLGLVTRYTDVFNKSVSVVPFPTLSEESALAVESSSMKNITLDFTRVQPTIVNNASKNMEDWDNKTWYEMISHIVNRWQARTDGFELEYNIPEVQNGRGSNPYTPSARFNGYVKSLTRNYNPGRNTELICTMEFHVGTMYVHTSTPITAIPTLQPRASGEFSIVMSNADQSEWYLILNGENDVNCVESYEMNGGVENPFEYAVIHISKKRLMTMAPQLAVDNNIIPGRNKLIINAVGKSSMTVVKCKLTKSEYVITAYCDAAVLRGLDLERDRQDTAFRWIKSILCDGKYGVLFREGTSENDPGNLIYAFDKSHDMNDQLYFKKGTKVWYILQICAMFLGCRLFFAEDNAYLIDFRGQNLSTSLYPAPITDRTDVDLYSTDPENPLYGRVTGQVSLGPEGVDTVKNAITVRCKDMTNNGEQNDFVYKSEASIDVFKEHSGDMIPASSFQQGGEYNQATILAENMLDYYDEPQQSVTFTLKEMEKEGGDVKWVPFFDPTASVRTIQSEIDEIHLNNLCELKTSSQFGKEKPQKLALSSFRRKYPEGATEYTFGQMSSISLASSTGQITSDLNNL